MPATPATDAAVTTAAKLARRVGRVDELERRRSQQRNEPGQHFHHAERPSRRDLPGRDRRQRHALGLPRLLAQCRRRRRHQPLYLNSNNSYKSETAWSDSGGGTSEFEAEPAYQDSVQSTGKRTVPDVSFDADPNTGVAIYDSYDNPTGPWTQIGGTSLSTPAWAGIIAIINQGRVAEGGTTLNGPTQTLPGLLQPAQQRLPRHHHGEQRHAISAGPGYDEVTGIGTPIASNLIPDMVAYGNVERAAPGRSRPRRQAPSRRAARSASPPRSKSAAAVDTAFNGNVTVSLLEQSRRQHAGRHR